MLVTADVRQTAGRAVVVQSPANYQAVVRIIQLLDKKAFQDSFDWLFTIRAPL